MEINGNYAWNTSINDTLLEKGSSSEENKDIICNVYDMASNLAELTTETGKESASSGGPRGGYFCFGSLTVGISGNGKTYSRNNLMCGDGGFSYYSSKLSMDSFRF